MSDRTSLTLSLATLVVGLSAGCGGDSGDPVSVETPDTLRFERLASGTRHSCGLTPVGGAICWGFGGDGQLGPDRGGVDPVPRALAADLRFRALVAGSQHTCGLSDDGSVHCWGRGAWGTGSPTPAAVPGATGVVELSSVFGHVCVLTDEGMAGCFGVASAGQLGPGRDPSAGPSADVVLVEGLSDLVRVVAGKNHSCALDAAADVWCWGAHDAGQLGVGDAAELCPWGPSGETTPCSIEPALVGAAEGYVDLVAGLYHTCALTVSGRTECWGDDEEGQLGLDAGADEDCSWVVDAAVSSRACALTPQSIDGDPGFSSLTRGSLHTCGLTTEGEAWCWGSNTFGQIGSGAARPGAGPELVAGGHRWVDVSGGQVHGCGVTLSSEAYCWGDGGQGQLGSSALISSSPVLVGE